jgi:hypothetical protein
MRESFTGRLRRFWVDDGIYLILMLVLFGLRYGPAFSSGWLYAPFRDNVWLYGCLFSRASEIALTGSLPYWIDTLLGGFPLYTTPHFSISYPFYFFGLLNYGKAIDVMYTLSYVTCFHNLILYLNLYVMVRTAGAKGLAAFCAATLGLICGNTEIYARWITISAAFSWFPLLIAGMIRLLRAPLAFRSIALFSLAAGLMCTASPSQPVIQSAFVSAIVFSAGIIRRWLKEGLRSAGHLLLGIAISAVIALGFAGAAFLPMAQATGEMIRAVGNHPPVIGHASIPWESFNASQLEPKQLIHVLFDSSDLNVLGGLYVGPFALLGLLLCVIGYRRADAANRFLLATFALIAIYFLLAGFGTHFGVAYLHFHVPLLNRMREAARNLVVFTTLTTLLSGVGFQAWLDVSSAKLELSKPWRRYYWIAITFGLAIFAVAMLTNHYSRLTSWLVLAVIPLAIVLMVGIAHHREVIAYVLVCLACCAVLLSPPGTLPFSVSEYLRPDNLTSHRVLRRVAQLPEISKYRVVILDSDFKPLTWADNASFYGIKTFYIQFTPVPLAQFSEIFDETLNPRKLRGGRYFICGQNRNSTDPNAKLLFTESGYRVYEVADAMGPYALVHSVKAFPNNGSFRASLVRDFDYQRNAGVQRVPNRKWTTLLETVWRQPPSDPKPGELELIVQKPNLVGIVADSKQPGLLILNERWTRDWHVRVDSYPAKLVQANFIQPAVAVPSGRHYVEFEYKPMFFWYLLILQRVTFGLLVAVAVWKLLVRRPTFDIQAQQ